MALPQDHIVRGMGLAGYDLAEYVPRHGPACEVHPFGSRVHHGLLRMTSRHYTDASVPFALWVYYHAPPNKRQMASEFGTHPADDGAARWWPATGTPYGSTGWWVRCIGQEWLNLKGWFIHPSRVQLAGRRMASDGWTIGQEDRVLVIDPPPRPVPDNEAAAPTMLAIEDITDTDAGAED